jgi:hypothetical protein
MLLWLALWWTDWLALEDFSCSLQTTFSEIRQRFIADSSPSASVGALINVVGLITPPSLVHDQATSWGMDR